MGAGKGTRGGVGTRVRVDMELISLSTLGI